MLFIPMLISTACMGLWFFYMFQGTERDLQVIAYNKIVDNREKIDTLKIKDERNEERLDEYTGISYKIMSIFIGSDSEKTIAKLEKENEKTQRGQGLSVLDLPGYAFMRINDEKISPVLRKKVNVNCRELYGDKHAAKKAKQIFARFFSYSVLGVALCMAFGVIIIATNEEKMTTGLMVIVLGTALSVLAAYNVYSVVEAKNKRRQENIARQFPGVVSKLTLLVTSGMIVNKAWVQTAYSDNTELYREMQRTAEELDNMVSPEAAYSEFIRRCNTKETSKLASAIIQNLSKGNAEIGNLLKSMSKEAWVERKNLAKQDAEKASGKLLIPTMILLMDILAMIVVPLASSL